MKHLTFFNQREPACRRNAQFFRAPRRITRLRRQSALRVEVPDGFIAGLISR
jgi:hypothetical protein